MLSLPTPESELQLVNDVQYIDFECKAVNGKNRRQFYFLYANEKTIESFFFSNEKKVGKQIINRVNIGCHDVKSVFDRLYSP